MEDDFHQEVNATFGLVDVKCDEHFLYKTAVENERIFELPLIEISHLEVGRRFALTRYLGSAVAMACAYMAYMYVANEWIKWSIILILAIIVLGLVTDPWDKFIRVQSKFGAFDLDVADITDQRDIDAFVVAVQSRVRQRKSEVE